MYSVTYVLDETHGDYSEASFCNLEQMARWAVANKNKPGFEIISITVERVLNEHETFMFESLQEKFSQGGF